MEPDEEAKELMYVKSLLNFNFSKVNTLRLLEVVSEVSEVSEVSW